MPKGGTENRTQSAGESGRKEKVTSIPQYISLIQDELQLLVSEEDSARQRSLTKKLKERLAHLHAISRERTLAREQTRRDALKILAPDGRWQQSSSAFKGNLNRDNGVEKWLEYERQNDEELLKNVEAKVSDIVTENQMLKEALQRRDAIRSQLEKSQDSHADATGKLKGTEKPAERIKLLEGIVKKQDQELLVLRKQITEENSKYVHIKKQEYQDIEQMLKPCVRKIDLPEMLGVLETNNKKGLVKNPGHYVTMSNSLQENVSILIEYVDRMRIRVEQTADRISEMEKDNEVCLKLLDYRVSEHDDIRLHITEVLGNKLDDWREKKRDFEREIQSLRQSMEALAREKRDLMEALDKATSATEEKKVSTPRARKISAPVMKPRSGSLREKPTEEKTPPPTQAIQTKMFNMGCDGMNGSPSINRKGLKKSVSVPNGPMRASYK